MIIVYNKISDKEIDKDAKRSVKDISKWFSSNPERKTCKTEFWYGKVATVRKSHIEADILKAAKKAKAKI